MTLTLELSSELESQLAAEAARLRLPLEEYVVRVLAWGRMSGARPQSGAEVTEYWQRYGLAGGRADIEDSVDHARALRQKAQDRRQM